MCIICDNDGNIPQNTKVLNCSGCTVLTHLPEHLPDGLKELWCDDCTALTHFPEHLPDGLKSLWCSGCTVLTHLPDHLPDGLEILACDNCTALTHFPDSLPDGLEILVCYGCISVIFGPSSVIEQVGKEIVESNYHQWCQKQSSKYFSIRNDSLIAEELVKKACHPSMIAWYTEWDEWKELKLMGMV